MVEDRNLDGSRYLQPLVHISGDSLPEECSHGKTYFPAYSERFSWAAIIGLRYWFLAKIETNADREDRQHGNEPQWCYFNQVKDHKHKELPLRNGQRGCCLFLSKHTDT